MSNKNTTELKRTALQLDLTVPETNRLEKCSNKKLFKILRIDRQSQLGSVVLFFQNYQAVEEK